MIDLHIIGQTIRHSSPNIAADSYNYIEVQCWFAGTEWNNLSKWLHIKQGDTEYTLELDENNRVTAEAGVNLSTGEWEIFLTGSTEISRITTIPIIINVYQSGLINAPLGELPMTVAEQLARKADAALTFALEVSDKAAAGEFDGKSFEIVDYYESLEALKAAVPEPPTGALYGVGTTPPLDIYGWSPARQEWVNNGKFQGAQGEQGKAGPYYSPSVDSSGNLSWSNNGGLENPSPVNIRGPQGAQGEQGEDGKGPYEFAREGGYTGTEKTLMEALVMVPEHHARHEAGGADPISVSTGMIAAKAVTRAKLADNAVSQTFTGTLLANGWTGTTWGAYQQLVFTGSGILAHSAANVDTQSVEVGVDTGAFQMSENPAAIAAAEAWADIFRAIPVNNGVQFNFRAAPAIDIPVYARVVYK